MSNIADACIADACIADACITDAWAERTGSPIWNTALASAKLLAGAGFSYWGITQRLPKLGTVTGVALSCLEIPSLERRHCYVESAHERDPIGKAGLLPLVRGIQLGTLASVATFFIRAVPNHAWKVVGGVVGLGAIGASLIPTGIGVVKSRGSVDWSTAGYVLRLWTENDEYNDVENPSLNGPIGVLAGQTDFPLYNAVWAATKLTTGAILTWFCASQYPAIGITAGALLSLATEFLASHDVDFKDFLQEPEESSKIARAGLLPFIRGIQLATAAALLKVIITTVPPGAWKTAGCTVGLLAAAPLVGGLVSRNTWLSDWEQTGIFLRVWSPKEQWHKSALIISVAKLALGGCLTWMGTHKFPGLGTTAGVAISLSELLEWGIQKPDAIEWQDKGNQKFWLGLMGLLPFIRGVQLATTTSLLRTIALTVPVGAWKVLGTLLGPAVATAFTAFAIKMTNKKSKAAGVALRVWYPKSKSRKSQCGLETLKLIGSAALGFWAIKRNPAIGLGLSAFLSGAEVVDAWSAGWDQALNKARQKSLLESIGALSLIRGLQLATMAHLPLTLYREMPLGFWIATGSVLGAGSPAFIASHVTDEVFEDHPPEGYSTLEKLGVAFRVWNSSSHEAIVPRDESDSDDRSDDDSVHSDSVSPARPWNEPPYDFGSESDDE